MSNYKKEINDKANEKLNNQIENIAPNFIKDFFISKPKIRSGQSKVNYWSNFKQFFDYIIVNRIVEKDDLISFTQADIQKIKAVHINQYLIYCSEILEVSDATIQSKLNYLKSLFGYFVDAEIISRDITKNITVNPPKQKKIKYATIEDRNNLVKNLMNMKNEYDRIRNIAIVYMLMGSGVRIHELVGLDVNDVDLNSETQQITVNRKGGDTDIVPISAISKTSLEEYLLIRKERETEDNKNVLFISEKKGRLTERGINDFIKKYSDGKLSAHMFRKGLAMLMVESEGNAQAAAEQLGHKTVSTTMRWYGKTKPEARANTMNKLNV